MRRLVPIAAFLLFLAVPLWAQRGGGGGHGGGFGGGHGGGFGGAHGGGFSGGRGGGFSGGHAGGFAAHSGGFRGGRMGSPGRSFNHSPMGRGFSHGSFHDHHGDHHHGGVHFHTAFGFRNNCFGFGCGFSNGYYPWWGYYYPWWWDDNSSSYDDDYNQNLATAAEMNRQNLEEQRMLRQEQADLDQDAYANRYRGSQRNQADPNAQATEKKGSPMFADTVLVFRDKHQEQVENYAIVGDMLWNFAPGHTQRISLDDLDLAATEKANEDRGMTFRLPAGS